MRISKPFIVRASAFSSVVLLVAVGSGLYITELNKRNMANSQEIAQKRSTLSDTLPDNLLTVNEIKAAAAKEAADAHISSVELEKENGVYVYRAKLSNGMILYFNAQTGARIIKGDQTNSDIKTVTTPVDVPNINFNAARDIALAQKSNGVISKIHLQTEDGVVVYDIRFTDNTRIDIRASDGAVLRIDTKNNDQTTSSEPQLDDRLKETIDDSRGNRGIILSPLP